MYTRMLMIDIDYITGNKKSKQGEPPLKLNMFKGNPNNYRHIKDKVAKIKGGTYYLDKDNAGFHVTYTNWDDGRKGFWTKKFKSLPEAERHYSKLR